MFASKPRKNFSVALRALRRRVLDDGEPFFRVISTDFSPVDFYTFEEARNRALDLASCHVGQSVFISERKRLEGVQCVVKTHEILWNWLSMENGEVVL